MAFSETSSSYENSRSTNAGLEKIIPGALIRTSKSRSSLVRNWVAAAPTCSTPEAESKRIAPRLSTLLALLPRRRNTARHRASSSAKSIGLTM